MLKKIVTFFEKRLNVKNEDMLHYCILFFVDLRMSSKKKVAVKLPFAMPTAEQKAEQAYNQTRPKPEQYAERTFPPPRGTRRSMGKR